MLMSAIYTNENNLLLFLNIAATFSVQNYIWTFSVDCKTTAASIFTCVFWISSPDNTLQ